ncbi:MAG: spore protease YyaC [Clostridioides sp.]|jgi:putative sporulation protein YyaC|nr:spore protease YyaC [Clostridioides sp.]
MNLAKVHYNSESVIQILSTTLNEIINDETVVICIGTDKVIGDTLGPIVGTILEKNNFMYPVYGTLDKPIHALNIYEAIEHIKEKHKNANFLAIDACLGSRDSIGNIQLRKGPILPGKGVGKTLPQIGDFSIVGIVDKIEDNRCLSSSNIRLSFIYSIAETIASSILASVKLEYNI